MSWFKLVGSTENPLPDNWVADLPALLTEMRFPWNKPPSDIWAPGHLILYAVGAGALIGIQQVDGPPQLRPRRGVPGSVENRWPHKLAVKTEVVCSPVSAAPKFARSRAGDCRAVWEAILERVALEARRQRIRAARGNHSLRRYTCRLALTSEIVSPYGSQGAVAKGSQPPAPTRRVGRSLLGRRLTYRRRRGRLSPRFHRLLSLCPTWTAGVHSITR
jgi:hypothetical protein